MEIKQQLGQFYTTNAEYITSNLITEIKKHLKKGSTIVDPFAGKHDLLDLFESSIGKQMNVIGYDIHPVLDKTILNDSLINPIDYRNKWIITNPPYLARNKCKDKTIFDLYNTNDLYKASIKSIMNCNGGILIVPLNFFCDEHYIDTRIDFLSNYSLLYLNIFEERVFEDTDYTVCAFAFIKKGSEFHAIETSIYPHGIRKYFFVDKKHNYKIGGEFIDEIEKNNSILEVSRLEANREPKGYISNIKLHSIDTGTIEGRIKLLKDYTPIYGKNTDRNDITIVLSHKLTDEQENILIEEFNSKLEFNRKKYNSLFLSNFRHATKHYARKRMPFNLAYNLIQYISKEKLGI